MTNSILWKIQNIIITLLFLLAVFIPFVLGFISRDLAISQTEKRSLAQLPAFPSKVDDFKEYPSLFDSYYSDHFGLRNVFVASYKKLKYQLGDSPSTHVTIGKDGWLFLGSIRKNYSHHKDPIGDYRNINLYSQDELKQMVVYMKTIKHFLSGQGIEYLFVIAPNKHTIYFDKLPNYMVKDNEFSATDQLVNYLREHTDVTVVDLRESLLKAKSEHQIYYKSDTHWNHFGANVAQYEIMKEIELMFPDKIHAESQNMVIKQRITSGDLGSFMGIYDLKDIHPEPVFNIDDNSLRVSGQIYDRLPCIYQSKTGQLKALVFRDSFFNYLVPYFARKFEYSVYLLGKLNAEQLIKYIELAKPDIVIEEWVERALPHVSYLGELYSLNNRMIFEHSNTTLFSNEWNKVSANKYVDIGIGKQNDLFLKIKGKYPIAMLEPLDVVSTQKYVVKITVESGSNSKIVLYNADVPTPGVYNCFQRAVVRKGANDIYLLFDKEPLGRYFRLAFMNAAETFRVSSLEIKQVN